MAKTDSLKQIVAKKKERLAQAKLALPEEELKSRIAGLPPARPFLEAINKNKQISLIAEIKKQSPSAGLIREDFSPSAIAAVYKDAGCQAISVLTEEDFFSGNTAYINEVRTAVDLPVLRKDFIFEPYQVYESRSAGADAILLIADLLSKDSLSEMIALADSLGMDCLVESHEEKELKKVLSLKITPAEPQGQPDKILLPRSKARKTVSFAVGLNNRDLRTLEVDLKLTERLYTLIPKDRVVVVESGLKSYQDILFLKILGVNAVLVGEAILKSADMKSAIQDIMGW
ncbi:MAG: indole-3-glycerol phosphate synthase TrpC [Candidatus Omnitrophica bacterium]|jgi:indole-3-glycerol phosphate synthase|nr:indole-3-glycerol phosphate synthase TrpC [Candidatus Omnitrophota bacterium]